MNNKLEKKKRKQIYDAKTLLTMYIKRYLIILAIALPIILFISYVLSNEIPGYSTTVATLVGLAMFLFSLLIGWVIFNKIDDKKLEKETKESKRDPFSD